MEDSNRASVGICKKLPGNRFTIYKVRVHSPKKQRTLVFIGDAGEIPQIKAILKKLHGGKKITKDDIKQLKHTFNGEAYQKHLNLTSENKTDGQVEYVNARIHEDDNMHTIRSKVAHSLGSNMQGVYMWVDNVLRGDKSAYWGLHINSMFNDAFVISEVRLRYMYYCLTGKHIDMKYASPVDMDGAYSRDEALSLLVKQSPGHVKQPLGMKYMDDKAFVYFPVNPMQIPNDQLDIPAKKDVVWDMERHLDFYSPSHRLIHVVIEDDNDMDDRTRSFYFPKLPLRYQVKNLHQEKDVILSKMFASFNNDGIASSYKPACYINRFHLRNEVSLLKPLDLRRVFNNFVPSNKHSPLLRLFDKSIGSIIKLSKKALADENKRDVMSYGKQDVFRKNWTGSALMCKINIVGTHSATLVVYSNGCSEVRIKYNTDTTSFEDASEHIGKANAVLAMFDKHIPMLDKDVFNVRPSETVTKIVRMSLVSSISSSRRIVPSSQIEGAARKLIPFFYPSKKISSNDSVNLIFKAVNGFGNEDQVVQYLKTGGLKDTDPEELFDMSLPSMMGIIDDVRTAIKNGQRNFGIRRQNMHFCTVQIKPAATTYMVHVDKVTHPIYFSKAIKLIMYLLHIADSNDPIVPAKGNNVAITNNAKKQKEALDKAQDALNLDNFMTGDDVIDWDDDLEDDTDVFNNMDTDNRIESPVKVVIEEELTKKPQKEDEGGYRGYGDLSDDDIKMLHDWVNQQKKDEKEDAKKHKKKGDTQQYGELLINLQKADPDLFTTDAGDSDKSYSTQCQKAAMRQPVVVTPQEMQRFKTQGSGHEFSFANHMKYGSPGSKQDNHYFCPQVWCPISRVPYSFHEFKQKGFTCPEKGEKPYIYRSSFWNRKVLNRPDHYVGLLSSTMHPKGLCAPCCFISSRHNQCDSDASGSGNASPTVKGNERYIKESETFPVDVGRYALLPPPISKLLGNQVCGDSDSGAGSLRPDANCFLRQGVLLRRQSFFSTMAHVLNNPALKTGEDIQEAVARNMSMETFLNLYEGRLAKKFVSQVRTDDIHDVIKFARFVRWFISNKEFIDESGKLIPSGARYVKKFGLQYMYNVMYNMKEFSSVSPITGSRVLKGVHDKAIWREFILYTAYRSFIVDYILNDEVVKTHDTLLELFNMQSDWLNNDGLNIVVFSIEDTEKVRLPCQDMIPRKGRPIILLIKGGQYYEPIYHVKVHQTNKQMIVTKAFAPDQRGQLAKLESVLRTTCFTERMHSNRVAETVIQAVAAAAGKVVYQVINYDFRLTGVWVTTPEIDRGFYLPLHKTADIIINSQSGLRYIDDMLRNNVADVAQQSVTAFIHELNKHIKQLNGKYQYHIESISDLYISFKEPSDCDTIMATPLTKGGASSSMYADVHHDVDIFIEWTEQDERTKAIKQTIVYEMYYRSYWNEVIKVIKRNKEISEFVTFCRHPSNPLPRNTRMQLIMDKLQPHLSKMVETTVMTNILREPGAFNNKNCSGIRKKEKCKGQCGFLVGSDGKHKGCRLKVATDHNHGIISKILYNLLNPNVDLSMFLVNTVNDLDNDDILILTDDDLRGNKFKMLLDTIGGRDFFGYAPKFLQVFTDAPLKNSNVANTQAHRDLISFADKKAVALPHIVKTELSGFQSVSLDNYAPHSLYELFAKLNTQIEGRVKYTGDTLRNTVNGKIIENYKARRDDVAKQLSENPSFKGGKALSDTDLTKRLGAAEYYPSHYDIDVIAKLLSINVLIVGRRNETYLPDRKVCLGKVGGQHYMFILNKHMHESKKYYVYDVVVKNGKHLFQLDDFSKEMKELLSKKCTEYFVNVQN